MSGPDTAPDPTALEIRRVRADEPHLDTMISWSHAEWGAPVGRSYERSASWLRAVIDSPHDTGLLALRDGVPVAMSLLVGNDLDARADLTPWLASVYVVPEMRRQGLASRLIRGIEALARERGDEALYLFTPDAEALYESLGWREIERRDSDYGIITVMERDLSAGSD